MVKPETGQANFAEKMVVLAAIGVLGDGDAVGELQRGLDRIGDAVAQALAHDDAVDHDLDIVLHLLVERRRFVDLVHLAVDLHALEAALLQIGSSLRYSPLRPRTIGASSSSRVPSGIAMMRSTICETVWLSIGRPVAGE